jgi:hypothetical protein
VTALKTPPGSAISKAATKMRAAIAKKCGGADKTCTAGGDDDALAAINWDVGVCPSFPSAGADCENAIDHCGDVGTCLECLVDHTVEQIVDGLLFDAFDPASFFPGNATAPGKAIAKCQATVAKQGAKFLTAKLGALRKCWDLKLQAKPGFDDAVPCPDTDPKLSNGKPPATTADNATVQKILAAEQKQMAGICKLCGGGGDKDKDLDCDATEQPVGGITIALADVVETPFACADVAVPPNALHPTGEDCGQYNPVDTLQKYVDCLDCQLDFKADCLSYAVLGNGSAGAAGGIAYPTACTGL